jgi:hypothetical protein
MLLIIDFYPCDFDTDIISWLITVTRQVTQSIITLLKYTQRCYGNTKSSRQIRILFNITLTKRRRKHPLRINSVISENYTTI